MILLADTFGSGMMLCSHVFVASWTIFQTRQHIKYAALTIIQKEDTQVAAQILIPQGILIIEETQVANHTEYLAIRDPRETCRC